MNKKEKRILFIGGTLLVLFVLWTALVMTVDVAPGGESGRDIGFSAFNLWFHRLCGVHMWMYTLTDWLGLVPVFVCFFFAAVGLVQLIRRRSLFKVDGDIILLGVYYALIFSFYILFEAFPINYRPILIEGRVEASYPSSTTLLVLGVMPGLAFQAAERLIKSKMLRIICFVFSAAMVLLRLLSGVHWFSDILASLFLSGGLFYIYKAAALTSRRKAEEHSKWNFTKNFRN